MWGVLIHPDIGPFKVSWNSKLILKVSAFYFEKQVLFLKKYFLSRCQYQNKKALFTDPIFCEGFEFVCVDFVKNVNICKKIATNHFWLALLSIFNK